MKQTKLEERVAALEKKVADLESELNDDRDDAWLQTVGMFSGDEIMKRIDEHARRFREADRRKARKRGKAQTKRAS